MDRLAPFFDRFALSARIFYSGQLCGSSGDHETERAGHLHVLRRGTLKILHPRKRPILVNQPSVLFYPRPAIHRFQGGEKDGAEIVCAQVEFGAGIFNPLLTSLPEFIVLPSTLFPDLIRPSNCSSRKPLPITRAARQRSIGSPNTSSSSC